MLRRSTLLLWTWALFGLILAGTPRWEAHQHVLADHGHRHAAARDHHDASALLDLDADDRGDDAAVTHLHALVPLPLATHGVELLTPVIAIAERPVFPAQVTSTPAHRWPPPHRPPIA